MPEFGDEHMQASGIEETVVAPKFEEDALGTDHFIPMLAKAAEDFRFTMRKFLRDAGIGELLAHGMEKVVAEFEDMGLLFLYECLVEKGLDADN